MRGTGHLIAVMAVCLISQVAWAGLLLDQTMWYDGIERTYSSFVPSPGPPAPQGYPLVVGLHGAGSTGAQFMLGTAFLETAAVAERFAVVCPDGINRVFNGGAELEDITGGRDDVGFISELIDQMILSNPIDPTRVYVMAHSNGGIMAYRLAAELPDKIAAIASNAGQMVYQGEITTPVPIIHMHGLLDPTMPYEGGTVGSVTVPSVETVMEIWRTVNGCVADPVEIYNDPAHGVIGERWASPEGQNDVELYTFAEGVHEWRYTDDDGLSATAYFWDFLETHTSDYAGPDVPEPGTMLLLGVAAIGLVLIRR